MLFSEKTQAFYDETLGYTEIPEDVVDIDLNTWQETLEKINSGFYVSSKSGTIEYSKTSKPGRFYSFDTELSTWVQSEEQKNLELNAKNSKNLQLAQKEYEDITSLINNYSEMLEDEDYSLQTQEELLKSKTEATSYRKELRSYLNTGDGSLPLPQLESTGG